MYQSAVLNQTSLSHSISGYSWKTLGHRSGGATYIRWGQTTCPDVEGTKLLYAGRAAGTDYNLKGGTSDRLCLPEQPEYLTYQGGVQDYSSLHGAEYEHGAILNNYHDHNVPCAVCHSLSRGSMIMIPARQSCPNAWTLEYSGYLASDHKGHYRTSTVCMDKDIEVIAGSAKNGNGALFYTMEANCNGLQYPPYVAEKELTCAVCTI